MLNFNELDALNIGDFELRKLLDSDAKEVFITRSNEQILEHLDIPKAEHLDDALNFIKTVNQGIQENKWLYWGIVRKGQSKIIGTACLWNLSDVPRKADIGFVLLPEFHGQGIMQQVIPALLQFAFNDMQLEKVEAEVAPANVKSIKLLEKFNFKFEENIGETDIYALAKS